MEGIYPNTRPLPDERVDALVAFATPGEFEPVSFALYPVRPLNNLKVRVSALTCPSGEISASRVDVRLATCWNIGFPSYTTVNTYRRLPELLERVSVHSSPARECQWYWLTVHVPDDARPGLYRGTVRVWDDGFDRALEIPLAIRVLGFRLQKDPDKHFSAYFYARNKTLYRGRDDAFVRMAADKDYRAMVDHGLDMLPTFSLRCEDGKRLTLAEAGELDRMLATGLKGPVPVTADSAIGRVYRDTTPGGKTESHWRITPLPPPAFYQRLTELFRAFESERKANGWPEFICCPIDEVDPSCKEFGVQVYAAVKAAGLRTYATKDPVGADAADYAPYLDIWCSQPYSVTYEHVISQTRHEFWCYPNHNAGEIKDRRTMCKGGRMTYGFGLWRSGYTTLIPWHWCWTAGPDPFDYLRGRYSGCGQRVDDEGEVIPAIYWECFREGYDDGRYLYTLQQAVAAREHSRDSTCRAAAQEGRRLLQETWDAIQVQSRYLADGMWPSEEFNAIRWRLAMQIARLLEYPASENAAVSFAPASASPRPKPAPENALYETARKAGALATGDLGAGFMAWKNGTAEGSTEIGEAMSRTGNTGLRWTVVVDHQKDGGEGGKYPVGWPRVAREFKPGELDLGEYDTLEVWVRVDSNRNEVSDDHTPLGIVISSHVQKSTLYQTTVDLGGEPRVWIPLRFSIRQMMAKAGAGAEAWKSIGRVQFYISEHDYPHQARLMFDFGEISLLRFRVPVLARIDAPHHVLLPARTLAFGFDVLGTAAVAGGTQTIVATLETGDGKVHAQTRQSLYAPYRIVLDLPQLRPGSYTLRLAVQDATGKEGAPMAQSITAHAGPLFQLK
jgi:hypothetical protein